MRTLAVHATLKPKYVQIHVIDGPAWNGMGGMIIESPECSCGRPYGNTHRFFFFGLSQILSTENISFT